jgi:NADH:ubiquinone oxidoreductase subunit E
MFLRYYHLSHTRAHFEKMDTETKRLIDMLKNCSEDQIFDPHSGISSLIHKITNKKAQYQCFYVACMCNPDPGVIDRLIHDYQIDMNQINDDGENCLMMACHCNNNLKIIKHMAENLKIDINCTNNRGLDCLMLACHDNTNPEIAKYLINDLSMDWNRTNSDGVNCLMLACIQNENPEIIKYLINDLSMDRNCKNNRGYDCLMLACMQNGNPEIIKYLINDLSMDWNRKNEHGYDCLMLACMQNQNLDVIKYLVNDLSMDVNYVTNYGENCLTLACCKNTNLEIIKYLINDLRMDINHTDNDGANCLRVACIVNNNLEIIKYLIESTDAHIPHIHPLDQYEKWKKIIKSLSRNHQRFVDVLNAGLRIYGFINKNDVIDFLQNLNPLLLMGVDLVRKLVISDLPMDPMDQRFRFNDYMKHVDDLQFFIVPIPIPVSRQLFKSSTPLINFTKSSTPLFNYNGLVYHGYRELVYESILCLREIKEIANFDQLITLSGQIPEYMMNLWIYGMYSKRFNIMDIRPCDIPMFLDHIDQYPTDFLTICTVENDLINLLDLMDTVSEELIQSLKHISVRCRLKRLYLWIHNKKIQSGDSGI